MKIFKLYTKTCFLAVTLIFASCEDLLNTEAQDSPNSLTPGSADVNFYMNSVQLKFKDVFNSISNPSMELVRMRHMYGPLYNNAYTPNSFNGIWEDAYSEFLQDADALIAAAEEGELAMHLGITQILKGYVLMAMVDVFGDIPYEFANAKADPGSNEFLNPPLTPGLEVYQAAYQLLIDGASNVVNGPAVNLDMYYGGDRARWVKFANTVRLKAVLLAGDDLVANSTAELENLASMPLITTIGDDFQFRYSTNQSNPDSRHPFFTDNYLSAAGIYIPNYLMGQLLFDKASPGNPVRDPRIRYYLYRQTTSPTTDINEMSCIAEEKPSHYSESDIFCLNEAGYWGRDHGDNDGIPPDGLKRTTYGIYPGGGRFDADQGESVNQLYGAQGAGILPIMLSSYTHFMLALAALDGADTGDAWELTEQGITESMNKVFDFPATTGYSMTAEDQAFATAAQGLVDDYINTVQSRFDAGSTEEQKDLVCKEFLLAAFGNGIEPYNNYRRFGYPSDLQPTKLAESGAFLKEFYYPNVSVQRNSNIAQKELADLAQGPFWDPGLTLN